MQARQVEVNVFHCSSVITAYEKSGEWQLALSLLERMPAMRASPNEVSYNAAISACEKGGQWQSALILLGDMPTAGLTPNEISFSAAISACEKGAQWQLALGLLDRMPAARLEPNDFSYNAAISACEKGDQWEFALSLLSRMPDARLVPNEISYNAAISACEKGGRWQLPLSLSGPMQSVRLAPSEVTDGAVVSACERGAQWQHALSIIAGMLASGLKPSGIIWGSLLSSMAKSDCSEKVPEVMESLRASWAGDGEQTPTTTDLAGTGGRQPLENPSAGSNAPSLPRLHVLLHAPGVVALFKPSGVTSDDLRVSLSSALSARGHDGRVSFVSRLDAPTSGVVPLALGGLKSGALQWLKAQFGARRVRKEYLCLCSGPSLGDVGSEGQIDTPLLVAEGQLCEGPRATLSPLGKEARTRYKVLEIFLGSGREDVLMMLLAMPLTGRQHQIRAQLAGIGRPLVGDELYGGTSKAGGVRCPRLFLHCWRVALLDLAGDPFQPESPLPDELLKVVSLLKKRV